MDKKTPMSCGFCDKPIKDDHCDCQNKSTQGSMTLTDNPHKCEDKPKETKELIKKNICDECGYEAFEFNTGIHSCIENLQNRLDYICEILLGDELSEDDRSLIYQLADFKNRG